nr:putative nucleotide-diphospho-sugar transferase [Novosphingobium silvae]
MLAVWRRQIQSVVDDRAQVVCMDEGSFHELKDEPDIDASLAATSLLNASNRRAFWIRRLSVLRSAFDLQGSVLHSDSDAFWLKNPLHLTSRADLVISIEHGLPKHITKRRGFVVCCGFFSLQKNNATTAFVDAWQAACSRTADDQISINTLIDKSITNWGSTEVEGQTCHTAVADFGKGPFRILALSNNLITREHAFDVPSSSYVAHPFLERRFHSAFVALYSKLVVDGTLRDFKVTENFAGMKRRDWATYCCYQQLGSQIPRECLAHAGYLATLAQDFEAAAGYFAQLQHLEGDALVDLYDLQIRRGQEKDALNTLGEIARSSKLSDTQLNKIIRHMARKPHPTGSALVAIALRRYSRPTRLYEGVRRLYLQARGAL